MSMDTVDELHSAEDQAHEARSALTALVAAIDWRPVGELGEAYDRAVALLAVPFCRCFCDGEPDDCCGCSCHEGPGCSECDRGWLVGQGYGFVEIPDGWSAVQRHDLCETFEGDEDAARAYAAQLGGVSVVWAEGPTDDDGETLPGDWLVHDEVVGRMV